MAEFAQFREVTAKLKKRFTLRKPNFREASESFKKLACELKDFKQYAGYCMLSAAQCEHNIVGSLREQQINSSSSSFGSTASTNYGSSGIAASRSRSAAANTATPSFLLGSSGSVGLDRIVQTATLTEYQTLMETARLFKDADEVNAAISAFAHAAQICPEALLPLLYSEWAEMYRERKRHLEAANIFLEGGLLRDAIDCFLAGQYFEDAYQCYLELFSLVSKDRPSTSKLVSISRSVSSTSAKSPASTVPSNRTMLPFFGRQKSSGDANTNKSTAAELSRPSGQPLHQPPAKSDGGAFSGTDHLIVDDYITTFLLRLYLYDPVKYEFPSPIIPLPAGLVQCSPSLKLSCSVTHGHKDEEEAEIVETADQVQVQTPQSASTTSTSSASGTGSQTVRVTPDEVLSLSQSFLPFLDLHNDRKSERTIPQLAELNMLLETLYLSYRNELHRTIDHDYANEDWSWSANDSSSSTDSESEDSELDVSHYHDAVMPQTLSPTKTIEGSSTSEMPIPGAHLTRIDSVDDDPPTTTTTTTTNATSTSSAFEKNDLDDISLKLEQLALQFAGGNSSRKSSSRNRPPKCNQGVDVSPAKSCAGDAIDDFGDIERKLVMQKRITREGEDHDEELRREIAAKLFPLLNAHQNQLLYLILKNKD